MKALIIALVVVIAGLATWRVIAGRVDLTKPEKVAAAFTSALKAKNVDKASKYWVPDQAETWRVATEEKLNKMGTGSHGRFFEDLSDGSSEFVASTRDATSPANEQTMTAGGTSVDLRQIDGKWYVCRAPI